MSQANLTILTESPLPAPVIGDVLCEFHPGEGTTASWQNAFSPEFIDVYVLSAGKPPAFVQSIPGASGSVKVPGTSPTDLITIQAFREVGGQCRGSSLASCSPAGQRKFIRGLCGGSGDFPTISSPILALNYLFLGAETPPCLAACNADGSSRLDISDAVYLLSFLFLGGPPPAGWTIEGGKPAPACETAGKEECAVSQAPCS